MRNVVKLVPVLPALLGLAGLTLAGGCLAEDAEDASNQGGSLASVPWDVDGFCGYTETPLIAGRTMPAGTVEAVNTDAELGLRITTSGEWKLRSAHVYAGLGPVPTNPAGIPTPALFPYHQDFTGTPTDNASFAIDVSDFSGICGDTLTVAVHAEVVRIVDGVVVEGQTAWAFGDPFEGPRWGWSFGYGFCCAPDGPTGCTLTQGYWKNHEEHWPTDHLVIGGERYTRDELLVLLRTPPRGDASLILGHQMIAALLNDASGAGSPHFATALADAQSWMTTHGDADGRLPYGAAAGTTAGNAGTAISDRLAAFNEGDRDIAHCDDGAMITPVPASAP